MSHAAPLTIFWRSLLLLLQENRSGNEDGDDDDDDIDDDKPKTTAEAGIIHKIYCENFMNHKKLSVDFCRNINFIHGQVCVCV